MIAPTPTPITSHTHTLPPHQRLLPLATTDTNPARATDNTVYAWIYSDANSS